MLFKKIFCTAIVLASYLLFTGFVPDCYQQLTLDFNSSVDEYNQDRAYCAENHPTTGLCPQEANASFNYNVDQNIAAFEQCCCENNWPCC